jgi:hypothetical protein
MNADVAKAMKERGRGGLQECVTDLCRALNLEIYHPYDSRKSDPGYPDCTIVDMDLGRIIYAELKTQKNRATKDQVRWLDALALVADARTTQIDVFLWRPSHWLDGTIEKILRGNPDYREPGSGRWFLGEGVPGDKFSLPL